MVKNNNNEKKIMKKKDYYFYVTEIVITALMKMAHSSYPSGPPLPYCNGIIKPWSLNNTDKEKA